MFGSIVRRLTRKPRHRAGSTPTEPFGAERLETRTAFAAAQLSTTEVTALLERASAATPSNDAIIAVVDRTGQILGVRTESAVDTSDAAKLAFAIDGAVAKARTGAFFSNGQAILTSRTVSHISQSTITQREVEANPNSPIDTINGPGYVAPIGIAGKFPPGILNQPLVDLFAIEHTNRTSIIANGVTITNRDSYGTQSGTAPGTIGRGISTMPGGLGIYRFKTNELIGGIGVFFPGQTGFATYEQGFVASAAQTRTARLNAPKALEAESIALETLLPVTIRNGATTLPPLTATLAPQLLFERAGFGNLAAAPVSLQTAQTIVNAVNNAARIYLGGIALQSFGSQAGPLGAQQIFNLIRAYGNGVASGADQPVTPGGDLALPGQPQPAGWLVPAQAGSVLTAAQVTQIISAGVAQSAKTRAQIRAQPTFAKMVLAVADFDGTLLGVYRMPDATVFSIDVAVAKARNTVYYASPDLVPQDRVAGAPLGTAFTNRTFRYLAVPNYPSGNSNAAPAPFSILNERGINPQTGLNVGPPKPASSFTTVLGFDSFNPGRNFSCPFTVQPAQNQNGVVFFPGSTAVYRGRKLAGGFGVSGDGVDQDDVVTFYGSAGYAAPTAVRADQYFVHGIRLPYIKFSRNAMAGLR